MQVTVLTFGAWLVLWRPHGWRPLKALQITLAASCSIVFLFDGMVRGFIIDTYQAAPNSTMVMSALANTTNTEVWEFFFAFLPSVIQWKLILVVSLALLVGSIAIWSQKVPPAAQGNKWSLFSFMFLLALLLIALALKPWRDIHPLVFWPKLVTNVADLKKQWQSLDSQRDSLRQRAFSESPALTKASPDTLVLVMSDSINRNHMSAYGYPRSTTPKLDARLASEAGRMRIFKHAWSADSSTIPALRNFFYFGAPSHPERNHLLSIAATAGYKTWWISNHDDLAIDEEHSRLADHVGMLNNVPGRAATSLDHNVILPLEAALRDESKRKLIVVHLLGAHPHYRFRFPMDQAMFKGSKDEIYDSLKSEGRSFWTRKLRNDYDSAIYFQDAIMEKTLELTKRSARNAVWVYLSDHGQEVGSLSDHAGHSANSADGYRIPLIIWNAKDNNLLARLQQIPVRSDWLGHSMISLLGISWKGYRREKDFTQPNYQWTPPQLPIPYDFQS